MFKLFNKKYRDLTEEILSKYMDDDLKVYPMAENLTTSRQIDQIEKISNIKLPIEVRTHLLGRFPGMYLEVNEEKWPRHKAGDVGPFWSFLYGVHSFTADESSEDWMRLDYNYYQMKNITDVNVLPILQVIGDADLYCIDNNSKIIRFDHELNKFENINQNFWEILEYEVSELRKRKDKKINLTTAST